MTAKKPSRPKPKKQPQRATRQPSSRGKRASRFQSDATPPLSPADAAAQPAELSEQQPTSATQTQTPQQEVEQRPDPTSSQGLSTGQTSQSSSPAKRRRAMGSAVVPDAGSVATNSGETQPGSETQRNGQKEPSSVLSEAKISSPLATLLKKSIATTEQGRAAHIESPALAGTGKTTSMIKGLVWAKGGDPGITPSDQQQALWDAIKAGDLTSVRLSSFTTAITDELKGRVEREGLHRQGVEARGINSLGFQAVTRHFGRLEPNKFTGLDLIAGLLGGNFKDLKSVPGMAVLMTAVDELVSLCKQNLCEPTPENLDQLSSHYDVDLNCSKERVYELVPEVLELSKRPQGRITFDDQVWLPLVLDLPIPKVDLQIVDEYQDLNRMQQELIYRSGHRIAVVGDEHQAIFGFAGADSRSVKNMHDHLAATARGVQQFPLTVTRRCGKRIVEEAKRYVPEYTAHESNPDGRIGEGRFPDRPKTYDGPSREIPWEQSYCAMVQPGDFMLCRVNAPLVSQCFRFLRRGIKANIQGRDVGRGLASTVNKLTRGEGSVSNLIGKLGDWLAREQANENAKRMPSDARLTALQDRHDCLVTFCDGKDNVPQVLQRIAEVFTDDKTSPGVKFSSIHKSKGLEARRVFYLDLPWVGPRPDKLQPWEHEQEQNLRYVAITRAIEELVYVS